MATPDPGPLPAAARRLAVILCAELRGFTRLSEVLEPQVVLELTSQFFELAANSMETRDGRLLTLHNDGLVGLFTSERPAQFAMRSLEAAKAIQREFEPVGERWRSAYGLPGAVSIGLHLGEVVLGFAGPSAGRRFVAFGDGVSIAERLVHRARAGEMILSGVLMHLLGGAGHALRAEPLPPLALARRSPVPIYGVLRDTRLDFT
jgi:adenylate cyclase